MCIESEKSGYHADQIIVTAWAICFFSLQAELNHRQVS